MPQRSTSVPRPQRKPIRGRGAKPRTLPTPKPRAQKHEGGMLPNTQDFKKQRKMTQQDKNDFAAMIQKRINDRDKTTAAASKQKRIKVVSTPPKSRVQLHKELKKIVDPHGWLDTIEAVPGEVADDAKKVVNWVAEWKTAVQAIKEAKAAASAASIFAK